MSWRKEELSCGGKGMTKSLLSLDEEEGSSIMIDLLGCCWCLVREA